MNVTSDRKDYETALKLQKTKKEGNENSLSGGDREKLLQVVKETVKAQLDVVKKERTKKEREERYVRTINEIMYKTGKPVPPRAPRVYKIVKPREIKQKMREQINGIASFLLCI